MSQSYKKVEKHPKGWAVVEVYSYGNMSGRTVLSIHPNKKDALKAADSPIRTEIAGNKKL